MSNIHLVSSSEPQFIVAESSIEVIISNTITDIIILPVLNGKPGLSFSNGTVNN